MKICFWSDIALIGNKTVNNSKIYNHLKYMKKIIEQSDYCNANLET